MKAFLLISLLISSAALYSMDDTSDESSAVRRFHHDYSDDGCSDDDFEVPLPVKYAKFALLYAAEKGTPGQVARLLQVGVPLDSVDSNERRTILDIAIGRDQEEVTQVIVNYLACCPSILTMPNPRGRTPLKQAALLQRVTILRQLIAFENEHGISTLDEKQATNPFDDANVIETVLYYMNEDPTDWAPTYEELLKHRHFQTTLGSVSPAAKHIHDGYMQRRMPS